MVGNAKGGLGAPYFSWENQKATWQGMVNLAFQGSRAAKLPSALFQRPPPPPVGSLAYLRVAAFLIASGDERG